jgi:hypothetical protein
MKSLAPALALTFALAAPSYADNLSVLLPSLSFPDDVVTSSTKNCDAKAEVAVCQIKE